MANIKEHSFINHYPLSLLSITHRVVSDKKLDIKENELYFETPIINFNSSLDRNTIRYHFIKHLSKYLTKIIKHSDEYIDTKYPDIYSFVINYDMVVTYGIYFQRFNEGTEEGPEKQVLSNQDDDFLPTYSFRGITPNFLLSPFKILAKANVYLIRK